VKKTPQSWKKPPTPIVPIIKGCRLAAARIRRRIMKSRVYVVTLAASLFVGALANAQVLGGTGGLGGNLGGATSGGLRNPGGMIHGGAQGGFGGSVDASGVRRTTSDVGARAARRAQSIGERARSTAGSASATASSSVATAGQVQSNAQNPAVMGGIAGSLEDSASLIKESQVAAPAMPAAANPVGSAPASADAVTPSKMLDVGASKQQAVTLNGANREAQLLGQGAGSVAGNTGANGVSAGAQGSAAAGASWQRAASQPAQ
jgi:hypothetical protein